VVSRRKGVEGFSKTRQKKEKLKKMLNYIYRDTYIAGIGSHLQIIALKEEN
jgi:hypothetical protein